MGKKLTNEQIEQLKEAGFSVVYDDPKTKHKVLFWKYQYGISIDAETGEVSGQYGGKEKNRWHAGEDYGHLCPAAWPMLTKLSDSLLTARDILMPERAAEESVKEKTLQQEEPVMPSERMGAIRAEGNASYHKGSLYLNQAATALVLEKVLNGAVFAVFTKDANAVYLQVSKEPFKNSVRLREVENKSEPALRASGIRVLEQFLTETSEDHVTMYTVELQKDQKTLALRQRTT